MYQTEHFSLFLFIDTLKKETDIDSSIRPSAIEGIISDEECEDRSFEEVRMLALIDSLPVKCRNNKILYSR